jgi:hypothetical protein
LRVVLLPDNQIDERADDVPHDRVCWHGRIAAIASVVGVGCVE